MLQVPLQPYGRHARHCASLPQCLPAHPSLPAAHAQVLVLSFNSIQRLEGLLDLTKLQRLDLAHNQIKKVGGAGSLAPGLLFLCVCKRECGGRGFGLRLLVGAEAVVRATCASAPLSAHMLHASTRLAALPRVRT